MFATTETHPSLPEYPDRRRARLAIERVPIFKKAVATNQANVKTLYDAGVKVAFGTDSGAIPPRIPGFAEHRELQLMVASGLAPSQAINCATANQREVIGDS